MKLLSIKIEFEHEGKTYIVQPEVDTFTLKSKSVKETNLSKVTRLVKGLVCEFGYNAYVDATRINDHLGGVGPRTIAKALDDLGYDSVFRKKYMGKHRYIRFNSLTHTKEEIEDIL